MALDKNTPLGITQVYDPNTKTTTICFCYLEESEAEYFQLEVWDENKQKFVPFDGKQGIIERQR